MTRLSDFDSRSPHANALRRLVLALALALLVCLGVMGGAWHFSDMLIEPAQDRPLESPMVDSVDDSSIVLEDSRVGRTGDTWYLEWSGGAGTVTDILELEPARVRRRFRHSGRLASGAHVALRAYPFSGDPLRTCRVPFENVSVESALGSFPAWYVPGSHPTGVVFVHGRTASRAEALRMLTVVQSLGMPSLVITYRNDRDAQPSPDGLYHLGSTEWEELEAGVGFAIQRGSRRIVLAGWSMGGAVIAEFLRRSALADSVAGIVLDAPVLDWNVVVSRGAREEGGVAPLLAPPAKVLVSLRTGFRWSDSGPRAWARQFQKQVPVLIFHGEADETAPITTSEAFAREFGERITLVRIEGAGHVQSWNTDPKRYEQSLRSWLRSLAREATGTSSAPASPGRAAALSAGSRREARSEAVR